MKKFEPRFKATAKRLFFVSFLLLSFYSRPILAVSLDQLFEMPAFVNLYVAIQQVNQAMKIAAMNPNDDWRRAAVRTSIQKLPAAIIGLAEVFEQGKLHDQDYEFVMSMLGGFVDQKSAPRIYSQFLKKPSADLIPKAGGPIQAKLDQESGGPGNRLVYDESATDSALAPANSGAVPASNPAASNKELVNLSTVPTSGNGSGSNKLTYDESATDSALNGSSSAGTKSSAVKRSLTSDASIGKSSSLTITSGSGSLTKDIQSDIAGIETAPANTDEEVSEQFDGVKVRRKPQSTSTSKRPTAPTSDAKKSKPVSQNDSNKSLYSGDSLKAMPIAFQVVRLGWQWAALYSIAHAEQQQSSCPTCSGQGGQQAGGGSSAGGGGGNSAQALFGLAAIMAAVSPMVAASMQADADKSIAQTQANAQMTMNAQTQGAAVQMAQMAQQSAMMNSQLVAQTASNNQSAETQRLQMQLDQLNSSQSQMVAMQQQQFQAEQDLNQQRIALSEQQLQANIDKANSDERLQLTMAGLSNGSVPGNSGSSIMPAQAGLAVNPAVNPATSTGAGSLASSISPGSTGAATNPSVSNPNTYAGSVPGVANARMVPTGSTGVAGGNTVAYANDAAAAGTSSLVKSASMNKSGSSGTVDSSSDSGHTSTGSSGTSYSGSSYSSLLPPTPSSSSRLTMSAQTTTNTNYSAAMTNQPQVVAYLQGQLMLNGSTRVVKAKSAQPASGDLSRFIASTGASSQDTLSFTQFRATAGTTAPSTAATK